MKKKKKVAQSKGKKESYNFKQGGGKVREPGGSHL
jgi:hypothetical protein